MEGGSDTSTTDRLANLSAVNELILEILRECGCAGYAHCFREVNKGDFRRMSVQEISSRIKNGSLGLKETHPDMLILIGVHSERIYQQIAKFTNIQNQNSLLPSLASTSSVSAPTDTSATAGGSGPDGRLEEVGDNDNNLPIFVSAAPTPKEVEEIDLGMTSDDDEKEEGTPCSIPLTESPSVPESVPIHPQVPSGRPKRAAAMAAISKFREKLCNGDFDNILSDDSENSDQDNNSCNETKRVKRLCSDGCSDKISDTDAGTGSKDIFIPVFDPTTYLKKVEREGRDYAEICTKIMIFEDKQQISFHNCKNDPKPKEKQEWLNFFKKFGPTITSIELYSWSWQPAKSNCPYNLVTILTRFCPNLEDLIFEYGLESLGRDRVVESEVGERAIATNNLKTVDLKSKTLLKLKKIVVRVMSMKTKTYGKVPGSVLRSILQVSPHLDTFQYNFTSKRDLDVVLKTLVEINEVRMNKLRRLEIRSVKKDGYLAANEITKLASLKAKNLLELILGNGLWEDVEGSLMEILLKNFPRLKKLVIYGNFMGNTPQKPNILIEIPPSEHLEHLEIGSNYEFAQFIEAGQKMNVYFNEECEKQDPDQAQNNLEILTLDEDPEPELISVTLKLRHQSNLHTIILGNLFNIDDLHFGRIPKISSFRVGSPWHLTLIYPPETSRKNSFPLVKELQIPDCHKDELFIRNLPRLFPSLEKCWIYLPSVKVVRSFFKVMANSKVKTLFLKIQFDFESTLETCFLERPSRDLEGSLSCLADRKKLETLKKYGMWEKWVEFYNVQLPYVINEELEQLDENASYAGLGALKNLEYLEIEHVPRMSMLMIPKGEDYWLGPRAEFSAKTIGFEDYPLSRRCIEQLPSKLLQFQWTFFEVKSDDINGLKAGGFRTYEPFYPEEESMVEIQPAMLQDNFILKGKERE